MVNVKDASAGVDGPARGRAVVWRVSLVALILIAGSITFALMANRAPTAHASGPFPSLPRLRQALQTHVARPAIALPLPVSKSWYFAEGRVGGGFREYLTLSNPDPTIDCTAQITYLPEGTTAPFTARKPLLVKTASIPHASRYTTSVNADLAIAPQRPTPLLLSAIVTVPVSACTGIVVERPMYFSHHGMQSGSDVMGASNTATQYYFADVPTASGSSSFMTSYLSILNPPLGSTASVRATYYASGHQVGTQTISVAAGARGTIFPDTLHMTSHVAAIVTSTQPVVVERSSYLYNVQEGIAGSVSSANSMVGSPFLYNNWLFAEGYTGGQTQENLLLANLRSTATVATITLEYQNGHRQSLSLSVAAYSQLIFNVNTANTHPTGSCDVHPCSTTPEVSAEVTATSVNLIVERAMFFHYSHTVAGTSLKTVTTGGTDVAGEMVATTTVANFAEGYTNTGYNEWLTLQNPTSTQEQVTATLLNEYGRSCTQTITIKAKGRATVDITMLVKQHLVQSGDSVLGYQFSMRVQAIGNSTVFVAERSMYFHTDTGIQGGTDVVGYNGLSPTPITEFSNGISANSNPVSITNGPDGNLWFTENSANQIGRITPAGVVTEFSTGLTTNAGLIGITRGPDGNLWFAEETASKVGRITPTGTITEFGTGISSGGGVYGITAGPDGNLWFTEYSANKIGRITPTGVVTEFSAGITGASEPANIVTGPDNNLWFTEYTANKIGRITPAGVVTEFSVGNTSSGPYGITAGPDGNLWFTEFDLNRIGRITPAGVVTEFSVGNTFDGLVGITAGPDGNLWFTELIGALGRITPAGVVTEFRAGFTPVSYLWGITVGSDGNLWMAEERDSKIIRCYLYNL